MKPPCEKALTWPGPDGRIFDTPSPMVLHRRDAEGSLYRLEHDGRVTTLISGGTAVANATCFSPDGRTMYHADSLAGVIRAWDYALDGSISNERTFREDATDPAASPCTGPS